MQPRPLDVPASIFLSLLVQLFLLLFLFWALIYGAGELALLSLVLLATGLGTYLWSRISLNRFTCEILLDHTTLFPGEKVNVTIRAANAKPLPVLFKADLFLGRAVAGSGMDPWVSQEAGLLWYQQAVFNHAFSPEKRGVYDLGPPVLRGGDLFGFFFKKQAASGRFELVVYPRIVDLREMPIPKREFYGVPGSRSPVEDPVYVFGTRDYQPGRPARGIHWKASARHDRLQEKLSEPTRQENVLILLDVHQFEDVAAEDDFERTLEVIASLICQLDRRRIAVGFVTNAEISGVGSRIIPVSSGPLKIAAILETLARVKTRKTRSMEEILSKGYPIPRGASILYFGLSWGDQMESMTAFMTQKHLSARYIFAREPYGGNPAGLWSNKPRFALEEILAPEHPKQ